MMILPGVCNQEGSVCACVYAQHRADNKSPSLCLVPANTKP